MKHNSMGHILHHVAHGHGGAGLLGHAIGGAAMLAGTIIETKAAEEQRKNEARKTAAHWVICDSCGRKFNYTEEGGSFNRNAHTYSCASCTTSQEDAGWTCQSCGAPSFGKVCEYCGSAKPEIPVNKVAVSAWNCPVCEHNNTGNFCVRCGCKKPER